MIPSFLIEKIRQLAYEKYLYRKEHGPFILIDKLGNEREPNALDDWLEAEHEIIHQEEKNWG